MDFSRVPKALNRENGDLRTEMGTQKLKKVPMGTGSLKWGPTWEQWIPSHLMLYLLERVGACFGYSSPSA